MDDWIEIEKRLSTRKRQKKWYLDDRLGRVIAVPLPGKTLR